MSRKSSNGGGGPSKIVSAPMCMCDDGPSWCRNDASSAVSRSKCSWAICVPSRSPPQNAWTAYNAARNPPARGRPLETVARRSAQRAARGPSSGARAPASSPARAKRRGDDPEGADGLGLLDRPGVRGAARVDARRSSARRSGRSRRSPASSTQAAARPDLRAAAGAGQGARAVGGAPRPRARRPGLRPGQARADARDPRHLARSRRTRSATRRPTPATARSSRWPGRRSRRSATCTRCCSGDLKSAFSMTEPTRRLGPDAAAAPAPCATATTTSSTGASGSPRNASIADFLIVMAVTDPDARPHQRASMFLVPADTPGVTILRDVPTMEHPEESSASSAATRRSSTRTCASRPPTASAARARAS